MSDNYEEARALQDHVQRIDAIMLPYMAAGIKAAMKLLGFESMRPRIPARVMPPQEIEILAQLMRDAGLLT
jgi:dihydrodipicolinate synthase/N-acetylneuraminate lyase